MISFVIPVYNELRHTIKVWECLKGIDNKEVVFVNDWSTDDTKDFLNGIRQKGVVVIHQENKGVNRAWNVWIKKAKWDYIFVINNDVIFDKYNINELVRWLDKYDLVSPLSSTWQKPFQSNIIKKKDMMSWWFRGFKKENKKVFYPIIEECRLWFWDDYVYRKFLENWLSFGYVDTVIHHFESETLKKFSDMVNPIIANDVQEWKKYLKKVWRKDDRFWI